MFPPTSRSDLSGNARRGIGWVKVFWLYVWIFNRHLSPLKINLNNFIFL